MDYSLHHQFWVHSHDLMENAVTLKMNLITVMYCVPLFLTSGDVGILIPFLWMEEMEAQRVTQGSTASFRTRIGSDSKIYSLSISL